MLWEALLPMDMFTWGSLSYLKPQHVCTHNAHTCTTHACIHMCSHAQPPPKAPTGMVRTTEEREQGPAWGSAAHSCSCLTLLCNTNWGSRSWGNWQNIYIFINLHAHCVGESVFVCSASKNEVASCKDSLKSICSLNQHRVSSQDPLSFQCKPSRLQRRTRISSCLVPFHGK